MEWDSSGLEDIRPMTAVRNLFGHLFKWAGVLLALMVVIFGGSAIIWPHSREEALYGFVFLGALALMTFGAALIGMAISVRGILHCTECGRDVMPAEIAWERANPRAYRCETCFHPIAPHPE